MRFDAMKKILSSVLMMAFIAGSSVQAVAAEPKMGVEFDKTAQIIPTENGNKIEVVEIFWYGCIHCYQMDPTLEAWAKKLPADVVFKRMPGLPQPSWEPMAKTFYVMEDLKVFDKLHSKLFDAIHAKNGNKKIAIDEKEAMNWVAKESGLDIAKVEAAYNSFSMKSRLARTAQYFRASGATGVPSLVIDGRYLTSSTMAGNNEAALKTADYIIANIRNEKAKAAKK
jgi:thiol:disulfide interchange protein DsbA